MVVQRRKPQRPGSPETAESGNASDDDFSIASEADSKTRPDEPFYITIFRVCGVLTVLLIIGSALVIFGSKPSISSNFRERQIQDSATPKKPEHVDVVMVEEEGLDELPPIELDPEIAKKDAFGVAQHYLKTYTSHFMHEAQQMQSDFASTYGGIRPSRHLLENTLKEFGGDAWVRLLQRKRKGSLHMVVLGDATAAGYGNYHQQAFSFGLESVLKNAMKVFDISFSVSNLAVEHATHFPYLWCISDNAALQHAVDIVYVDLGEITAPELELVLRQVLQLGTPAPLLILRDTKQDVDRIELLEHYIEGGILQSPVLMEWKNAAVGPFLKVKPSRRPPGFLEWDQRGASDSPHVGANGVPYWTAVQHTMVGRVLAMFLLKQLELMVAHEEGLYELEEEPQVHIPSPIMVEASSLKEPWSKYLYHSSPTRTCLSSFNDNLHPSAGSSTQDILLEHPKGMLFYANGWVLDLENSERKEKLRSQHLGFKDMLASYHGIPASGVLNFDLQLKETSDLIVCEAQSGSPQPSEGACKLDQDVEFTLNKDVVKSVKRIETDFVSYEGKRHCYLVQLAKRTSGKVTLGVHVTNEKVILATGPCSVSHIVWQEDEERQGAAGGDAA
jgi:hypothetical protein